MFLITDYEIIDSVKALIEQVKEKMIENEGVEINIHDAVFVTAVDELARILDLERLVEYEHEEFLKPD